MNYSLGNMLGGAGALNPDKLALNLQFATDKTLTARKGPTPVFTRASSATQVGSTGLIEFAPENTLQRSEEFDNATYWSPTRATVTANATTSPTGTLTADKLVTDSTATNNHRIDRSTTNLSLSTVYTLSIYVKASEYSGFGIGVDASSPVLGVQFSLSGSGSVTAQLAGYTGAIQDAGNGWFRCSATFTSNASLVAHRVYMYLGQNGTTFTYTGDGTSGIFIWGAQLERYASARTYIPTTTADVFKARFDHDPITLACRGLLIEESRTNLALQSENHPSATWNKTGVTVASATNTAPNGSTTSNLVSEDSSTGLHRIFQSTAYVTGTSYAISVFLKYAGRQFVAITHPAVATNNLAIFDIQNGSISLTQSGVTASITAYPNGWYRCVVNGVAATTATQSHIIQGSTTGGTLTGSYTGLNGAAFYIYGSQVEAGAFPTSYIPTTTASVVRSVDICSITGASFTSFYNQNEGTLFVNAFTPANGDRTVFAIDDNTANEMIRLRTEGTNLFFKVTDGGSDLVAIDAGTVIANTTFKLAGAYKLDDFASSINGGASITDTNGTIPTVDRLRIGAGQSGNTMCGCISSLCYYKKRLPNAKLQTLTA